MSLPGFADHFRTTFPDLEGEKVLVALSGGPDSVALLHLLLEVGFGLRLEAAHVHHGTRGVEADRDAEFCAELCRGNSIPFHHLRIDVGPSLPAGREGTWRQHRYDELIDLAARIGAAGVATGHHRDDVAEGVLVQLLRGGGPRALAGIAVRSDSGVIRPLLPWTRSEILGWLQQREIPWREDSSNASLDHLRNRVRIDLLPHLESASPSVRDHLVELAAALAASEAFCAEELRGRARWIDPWEPDGGVEYEVIRGLPQALRSRWLHAQALQIGINRVTRAQLELFEAMLKTGTPSAVTLAQRWRIRRARGRLWLEPPVEAEPYELDLSSGETVALPLPGWQVRVGSSRSEDRRWSRAARPDARLQVRSPRPDDLLDLQSEQISVARMMARHLPRHLRRTWPVFCEDDRICWIPGVWQHPVVSNSGGHVVEVIRRERPASRL
jgi:tRNA(Ile)-lysidine synthase